MELGRRQQVLELCVSHGLLIVEDDSYGDLYFADAKNPKPRIPSIFSLEEPQEDMSCMWARSVKR